jgi:hypothetical protein
MWTLPVVGSHRMTVLFVLSSFGLHNALVEDRLDRGELALTGHGHPPSMLVAEGPPPAPESCRPGPPLPPAETTPGRSREVIRVSLPCHMAAGAQTSSAGPCQDEGTRGWCGMRRLPAVRWAQRVGKGGT